MALYQHSAFRRYLRNRRGVLLHDYQQRRLAERQRGGAGMDFRSARYLCFLEAGECNLRFLYLRSAPGTEILPKNTYAIPTAFFDALPFLITALVLVISSMRKNKGGHIPAHLGMNYFREER